MNGHGASIGLALRKFCKKILGRCLSRNPDDHWQLWSSHAYPQALKALMGLPAFKGNEALADADICGYYRGLHDAQVLAESNKHP